MALAVLRLIARSCFVGCSMGRSPGLAPLRNRAQRAVHVAFALCQPSGKVTLLAIPASVTLARGPETVPARGGENPWRPIS